MIVLVVDTDLDQQVLAREQLIKLEHTVLTATSYEEAVGLMSVPEFIKPKVVLMGYTDWNIILKAIDAGIASIGLFTRGDEPEDASAALTNFVGDSRESIWEKSIRMCFEDPGAISWGELLKRTLCQ